MLNQADLWSRIGLIVGVTGFIALVTLIASGVISAVHPLLSVGLTKLVLVVGGSTAVQIGVRLRRGQHDLAARLEALEVIAPVDRSHVPPRERRRKRRAKADPIAAPTAEASRPEDVEGLTPEMVDIARNMSARLRGGA